MRRLIILSFIALLPTAAMAEEIPVAYPESTVCAESDGVAMSDGDNIDALMEEYGALPGCTTINISNAMLETMNVALEANFMMVISVENSELIPTFKEKVKAIIGNFDVIMSVNSGGESVNIYNRRDSKGAVTDLYIHTTNSSSSVLIYIQGSDIELSNISSLIGSI